MGKVVKLASASPRKAPAARSARRRRRARPSKTALVLGGGGLTGGVYEIGALRALDLLPVDGTVNRFDVYVGTSAGSFVAALAAAGVTPDEMMRVVCRQGPTSFPDIDLGQLLRPNVGEFARRSVALPGKALSVLRQLAPNLRQVSVMDLALGLGEALPKGLYSGAGIEDYLREVLSQDGRTDDFRELRSELYVAATDLDTCERIVFGAEGWDDVPISTAVRASTAMPMLYQPVTVRDRELVDGGVVSTTNLDIAVEAGAGLIVVVNPLVPYVDPGDDGAAGADRKRISDMGLPQIGYQAFKLMAHQRLHELATQWEDRYPGVDIVLIEPELDDELMFRTSMMNFASRIEIARHGFESVTRKLASDYERLAAIGERHGIAISAARIAEVAQDAGGDEGGTRAWRRILGQTRDGLLRQSGSAS